MTFDDHVYKNVQKGSSFSVPTKHSDSLQLWGSWRHMAVLGEGNMYIYVYIHIIEVLCKYSKHNQHCKVMFDKLI